MNWITVEQKNLNTQLTDTEPLSRHKVYKGTESLGYCQMSKFIRKVARFIDYRLHRNLWFCSNLTITANKQAN